MARNDKELNEVTIFDVAREAGVSYATVSRVINNKEHVKPDKRERVLHAMTRLGYVANQQARSLAGGRSRVIGLLVQGLESSYTGEIVRGIDLELEAAQYDLMLYTTHRRRAKESAYVTTISRGLADGLLLMLPRNPEAYLQSLQRQRFPYVLIDHQGVGEGGAAVGATNRQGGYEATRHLIELGHQRIGFITGSMDLGCSLDRMAGYHAALNEFGIAPDPSLVFEGDFLRPTGFTGAFELLSRGLPPTAIFASNDEMAFGVIDAARDRGLRIPDDLSVVGFDDIPHAAKSYPSLTTVRQPLEQMGRVATQMLLRLIDNAAPAERVELPTELIVRQSTKAPGSA